MTNAQSITVHRPIAAALALALAGVSLDTANASPLICRGVLSLLQHSVASSSIIHCNNDGDGSLRQAIATAHDGDVIDIDPDPPCALVLPKMMGDLRVTVGHLTLRGPPHRFEINANSYGRIFTQIPAGGTLTLENLYLHNGHYYGPQGGGCIFSSGSVTLTNSVVTQCSTVASGKSDARGGAVYAHDIVTVAGSEVLNSSAYAAYGSAIGGGVWAGQLNVEPIYPYQNVSLIGSTISGNTARVQDESKQFTAGGGGYSQVNAFVANSSVSRNTARYGGGIFTGGACEIFNSTINANTGSYASAALCTNGAGIYNSTIVGNNGIPTGAAILVDSGSFKAYSSIIFNVASRFDIGGQPDSITAVIGSNNIVGLSEFQLPNDTIQSDPHLDAARNNGGTTDTLLPQSGSPALGGGTNTFPIEILYDQRGYPRGSPLSIDIGAVQETLFRSGFDGKPP